MNSTPSSTEKEASDPQPAGCGAVLLLVVGSVLGALVIGGLFAGFVHSASLFIGALIHAAR